MCSMMLNFFATDIFALKIIGTGYRTMSCTIRTLTNINISLILGHTKHDLLQFINDVYKQEEFRASNTEDFHIISNAILDQRNDGC